MEFGGIQLHNKKATWLKDAVGMVLLDRMEICWIHSVEFGIDIRLGIMETAWFGWI
jgi:hypothetical protein